MPINLDISADYRVFNNTYAVTFFRKTAEATFAAGVSIAEGVVREAISKEEMQARGLLAKAGARWHLPAVLLPGVTPKIGDVVQDANGARWTVLQVDTESWDTRHVCTTVKER